ncbi:hypothetical protein D3C80_1964340 [compost metagenome]
MVRIIPRIVNSTVTRTEMYNERRILASAKIFLYASMVKPCGHRKTLLAMTKESELRDFDTT